ncbi:hypothetical protein PZA11_006412 [Diplocarpon coronariae]
MAVSTSLAITAARDFSPTFPRAGGSAEHYVRDESEAGYIGSEVYQYVLTVCTYCILASERRGG